MQNNSDLAPIPLAERVPIWLSTIYILALLIYFIFFTTWLLSVVSPDWPAQNPEIVPADLNTDRRLQFENDYVAAS